MDYSIYRVVVAVHVFSVFVFLFSHGTSASVAFKLRGERNREKVAALLELSSMASVGTYVGLLAVLVTAFIMAWLGEWFGAAWFWTALVVFFVISIPMTPMAARHFTEVRRSMGVKGPPGGPKSLREPRPPMTDEELDAELSALKPWGLTLLGFGGVAVLQWLMMFKPF